MNTTTVNTFPPLHAFDSPKGWFMAIIVLLHVGFIWAVNSGLSFRTLLLPQPPAIAEFYEAPDEPQPPPEPVLDERIPLKPEIFVPVPAVPPNPIYAPEEVIIRTSTQPRDPPPITRRTAPQPTIIEPAIPAQGLSEPLYPASDIRAGHEGTVMLSLEILENGRVGQIRLRQSSGYASLDRSATREARKWRFKPGTRDGVPVVLWKEVPITFEIQEKN
jgi:protein TonB